MRQDGDGLGTDGLRHNGFTVVTKGEARGWRPEAGPPTNQTWGGLQRNAASFLSRVVH
jgi:hypothetical protein